MLILLFLSGYWRTDSIYPRWSVFFKPYSIPEGPEQRHFQMQHCAKRKEIERLFGLVWRIFPGFEKSHALLSVLYQRFFILSNPARTWSVDFLLLVWKAALIIHNMIVARTYCMH